MALEYGKILENRYRVVRLLGQGGFGSVYRGWDIQMHGACAIKENLNDSPVSQNQFEREARMLFQLRHPSLPRVYDQFIVRGQGQYLVMDYIEGENLDEILERNAAPLPQAQVLGWITRVIDALDYLHTRRPPIIHRDVKPANIIVTDEPQVYLVDFGISKLYDPGVNTSTGARGLTVGYAPPEQYASGLTDVASDVYALGATLYHLLTFEMPPDSLEMLLKNASRPLPAHEINPEISPQVGEAIGRAMELEKSARWRSVKEFGAALTGGRYLVQRALPADAWPETLKPSFALASAQAPADADMPADELAAVRPASGVPGVAESSHPKKTALSPRNFRRHTWLAVGLVLFLGLALLAASAINSWMSQGGSDNTSETGISGSGKADLAAGPDSSDPEFLATVTAAYDQADIAFSDPFDNNDNNWDSGSIDDEYWKGDYGIQDGAFRIRGEIRQITLEWFPSPYTPASSPFLVSASMRQVSGDGKFSYGLVYNLIHLDNGEHTFYTFTINGSERSYTISRQTATGWDDLFGGVYSEAIDPSGPNRLSVYVQDDLVSFYINGQYVEKLTESGLSSGEVGLMFTNNVSGQSGEIAFDDFEVRLFESPLFR